jgi:hypothetical protein
MKMFGMCIDKRVVAGVAVAALLVWVLAPGALAAALPFLFVAICPLSMLVMMKMMNSGGQATPAAQQPTVPEQANAAAAAPPTGAVETSDPTVTDAAAAPDARWN